MQSNHCQASFDRIWNVGIVGVLAGGVRRWGTIGQHLFHGAVTGTTVKLDVTDGSNLAQTEVRILSLQIHALADASGPATNGGDPPVVAWSDGTGSPPEDKSKLSAVGRLVRSGRLVSLARSAGVTPYNVIGRMLSYKRCSGWRHHC